MSQDLETNRQGSLTTPRSHHLTELQSAFAVAFVDTGGNATEAARIAGCPDPQRDGANLFRHKAVFTAIHFEMEKAVIAACIDGARCMHRIINEKPETAAHKSVQVQALKALQARQDSLRSYHEKEVQASANDLGSLSISDLKRHIASVQADRDREMKVIAHAVPSGIGEAGQALDA